MKRIVAGLLAALVLLALVGCAAPQSAPEGAKYNGSDAYEYDTAAMPAPAPAAASAPQEAPQYASAAGGMDYLSGTGEAQPQAGTQKIIRNASVEMETETFADAVRAIVRSAEALGGAVQSTSVYGRAPKSWTDSARRATLVVSIPAEKLDEYLDGTRALGTVMREQSGSENVTAQYYDMEARKKTLEIELTRLEAILTETSTLADIIELEKEIARVRYEIEAHTADLRHYDALVAFSTVTIDVVEVNTLTRENPPAQTFGARLKRTFSVAWLSFGENSLEFFLWLVSALPTLLVLAVIGLGVWAILRRAIPASRKRRAARHKDKSVKTEFDDPQKKNGGE